MCEIQGCRQGERFSLAELSLLRGETVKAGLRTGLISPVCVREALANTEEYGLDIPLWELVVEAAKDKDKVGCRTRFTPAQLR